MAYDEDEREQVRRRSPRARGRPRPRAPPAARSARRARARGGCGRSPGCALAISHAPGRSGTPSRGHCSGTATKASCATSSASPTSRSRRVSEATRRGHSSARPPRSSAARPLGLLLRAQLLGELRLLLLQLRRKRLAEVLGEAHGPGSRAARSWCRSGRSGSGAATRRPLSEPTSAPSSRRRSPWTP